ncbi:hypothetical protein WQ57_19190 [Mesobacillus campisalis]|uniref:Teichoic acid biosynthesis protein B n=1 Tax=Mesobacillus campisalis TaxID=1408103 RepID=A0A0M2SV21_9BACI|nr:CDP-glycerol glycerophosphotransferase family protein [Mesobacillus campisalis]KKK36475.1 hypothetical protein WQ57_19190 [Mesobacillus campisalis]
MARELGVFLFLFFFKWVFFLFNLFPLKEKTTFVVSFGDNSKYVFDEMRRRSIQVRVVVLCNKKNISLFKDYLDIVLIPYGRYNIWHWFSSIYHLATSRYIMIDNYYGFLAAVDFKKEVECIQLWHASGALKKFGLEDESIKSRSPKAIKRFLQVYSKFHKVVVGSDVMAAIFIKSFNLKKDQILTTGVPRTDFFFNEEAVEKARKTLTLRHPGLKNKKVILYAPTYRDDQLDHFIPQLDIGKMAEKFAEDYVLFLRLHPSILNTMVLSNQYPDFVVDVSSSQYDINELLVIGDYLITDYSSISFEYSLLQKPIIFFTYDLEKYKQTRGVLERFDHNIPGPIVRDTDSIIDLIETNSFDFEAIHSYAETWNKYSKGHSSYNLVKYMFPEHRANSSETHA